MKHSVILKFLAMFLAAFSLMTAVAGTVGIVAMENAGLYVNGLDELQDQKCEDIADAVARSYATLYAVDAYSNLNYTLRNDLYSDPENRADAEYWFIRLEQDGEILVDPGDVSVYSDFWTYTVAPHYPIASNKRPAQQPAEDATEAGVTAPTTSSPRSSNPQSFVGVEIPEDYLYYETHNRWEDCFSTGYLYYCQAPEYTVTVYLQREVLESSSLHLLTLMFPYRYWFIAVLALGVMLFFACAVEAAAAVCFFPCDCGSGDCRDRTAAGRDGRRGLRYR